MSLCEQKPNQFISYFYRIGHWYSNTSRIIRHYENCSLSFSGSLSLKKITNTIGWPRKDSEEKPAQGIMNRHRRERTNGKVSTKRAEEGGETYRRIAGGNKRCIASGGGGEAEWSCPKNLRQILRWKLGPKWFVANARMLYAIRLNSANRFECNLKHSS